MKIALAQLDCKPGDVPANIAAMEREIARLATGGGGEGGGADLVVFPEMCDTGYEMDAIARKAGAAEGEARARLAAAAGAAKVNVVAGLSLREGGDIYNTAVAFDRSGAVAGEYRKIHLFTGEPQPEDRVMRAGDRRVVVPLDGVPVGLMICYDLRFPELARSLMLDGAHLLVVPAAWPAVRVAHWSALLQVRAMENQCVVAGCNRAGEGGGIALGGQSAGFGPMGEGLGGCDSMSGTAVVDADLAGILSVRARFRWLRDRRPAAYRL